MAKKQAPRSHGPRAQRREAIRDTSIPLSERLQIEYKQLFKAMAIISCCRYASDSMWVPQDTGTEPDRCVAGGP